MDDAPTRWPAAPLARAAQHWGLDPAVTFLNHGSFGACPRAVLEQQSRLRRRMEAEPVRFFTTELEPLLERARRELAAFVGADAADLAFVTNATAGVNSVLRSLHFAAGDEIVITNHGYNACNNAARFVTERAGAQLVTATVPFPIDGPGAALGAVLAAVSERTRLVLVDHVTSPTGLVLPVEAIVRHLHERGIDTLVDGAHAPGMLALDLDTLGAAYYTGNCHKWLCAPKGAAFLHVRRDRQDGPNGIRPLSISHGANAPRSDRSHFRLEFDWTGTADPTAWLCVGLCIDYFAAHVTGGWPAMRAHNHALALAARRLVCETLNLSPPAPDTMLGSLAAIPLPQPAAPDAAATGVDPLHSRLMDEYGIEAAVFGWPTPSQRMLRLSAQLYNERAHYERLAAALTEIL